MYPESSFRNGHSNDATELPLVVCPFRRASLIKFASIILFTAMAAAPFPFGSTDPSVIAVWCVVLGFALILASARGVQRWQGLPLIVCGILVALYAAVIWLQVSSPPLWAAAPDPAWREAGAILGAGLNGSMTAIRNEPFFAFGAPLLAILAFAVSYLVCLDEARARQLLIGDLLVRRILCRSRPRAFPDRSDQGLVARQARIFRFSDRNVHKPKHGGGLFRQLCLRQHASPFSGGSFISGQR